MTWKSSKDVDIAAPPDDFRIIGGRVGSLRV
ncbi:hypothetical protein N802_02235 [Knoellia sinensis KCTC 19936]|uniref:Uncharacterized protein n=1 Tax=Knoellia sinensis KCTC 19936 TaxID=1385520 RepID=A0A0A0JD44_9MICO|nr:hypothetical protein N802_02235 [Knoellia sinensis KCTC 19936]